MEKAHPGQKRIPAKDWNEIRDFINRYAQQPGGMVNNPLNPFLVWVKNNTSNNLPAFSVVKLDGAIYPQRASADTKDAALNQLLEISGNTPTGEAGENIGILQEDVPTGQLGKAVVVGASLVYVQVDNANTTYKFAKSLSSCEKLQADESEGQVRIVWKESGTGKKWAYVILDQTGTPTPEYFVINKNWNGRGTPPNTPSIFTKGSLHYVTFDGAEWIPHSANESTSASSPIRPSESKLVICQEDAPNDAKNYRMPYYTPESNMGVPPIITSTWSGTNSTRAGVVPGEHTFTDKWVDYHVTSQPSWANSSCSLSYEPVFIETFEAIGQTGGGQYLYIEINNQQYQVFYPLYNQFMYGDITNAPDIYPGDLILVSFNTITGTGDAVDYPTDYPVGTIMPWYRASTWTNPVYPGRGWEPFTPQPEGEIQVVQLNPNGQHFDANQNCIYVEAGNNDKIPVKESSICFIEKVKTNAIT